jgi:hypothetical protein
MVEEFHFLNHIYSLHPTAKISITNTIKTYIKNFYKTDKEKYRIFFQIFLAKFHLQLVVELVFYLDYSW